MGASSSTQKNQPRRNPKKDGYADRPKATPPKASATVSEYSFTEENAVDGGPSQDAPHPGMTSRVKAILLARENKFPGRSWALPPANPARTAELQGRIDALEKELEEKRKELEDIQFKLAKSESERKAQPVVALVNKAEAQNAPPPTEPEESKPPRNSVFRSSVVQQPVSRPLSVEEQVKPATEPSGLRMSIIPNAARSQILDALIKPPSRNTPPK